MFRSFCCVCQRARTSIKTFVMRKGVKRHKSHEVLLNYTAKIFRIRVHRDAEMRIHSIKFRKVSSVCGSRLGLISVVWELMVRSFVDWLLTKIFSISRHGTSVGGLFCVIWAFFLLWFPFYWIGKDDWYREFSTSDGKSGLWDYEYLNNWQRLLRGNPWTTKWSDLNPLNPSLLFSSSSTMRSYRKGPHSWMFTFSCSTYCKHAQQDVQQSEQEGEKKGQRNELPTSKHVPCVLKDVSTTWERQVFFASYFLLVISR